MNLKRTIDMNKLYATRNEDELILVYFDKKSMTLENLSTGSVLPAIEANDDCDVKDVTDASGVMYECLQSMVEYDEELFTLAQKLGLVASCTKFTQSFCFESCYVANIVKLHSKVPVGNILVFKDAIEETWQANEKASY